MSFKSSAFCSPAFQNATGTALYSTTKPNKNHRPKAKSIPTCVQLQLQLQLSN